MRISYLLSSDFLIEKFHERLKTIHIITDRIILKSFPGQTEIEIRFSVTDIRTKEQTNIKVDRHTKKNDLLARGWMHRAGRRR